MLRRFLSDRRGVSAVEFALIAPVMILMFFGAAELNSALTADRRVTVAASAIADLTAQDDEITIAELDAIFTAGRAMMAPHDPQDRIQMVISSVRIGQGNQPRVVWSNGYNRAARATGSTVDVPAGLLSGSATVILAEVRFDYEAPASQVIGRPIVMEESLYLRPRRSQSVCRVANNGVRTC